MPSAPKDGTLIRSGHILKTKFTATVGGVLESWSHVESDDRGQFVARYESRTHRNEGRRISDGWKKFGIGDVAASEDGWS
jgi:hypothetical protein